MTERVAIGAAPRPARTRRSSGLAETLGSPRTGHDVAWDVAHLPRLDSDTRLALFDLPRAWCTGGRWRPRAGYNRELLWAYADRHGLGGVVGALARQERLDDAELARHGERRHLSNLLYHEQAMVLCRRLQAAAVALRIPLAFVKGPALVSQAYPDPGVRGYSDIDLVVARRRDAIALVGALGYPVREPPAFRAFRDRGRDPGKLHLSAAGWDLEFAPLGPHPCSPLFDLLRANRDRVLRVPRQVEKLSCPEPEIHLVLLLQHLAQHMCSRLVWFLDLPLLVRSAGGDFDSAIVVSQLERLQLLEVASRIASFCGERFGQQIPLPRIVGTGRNRRFLSVMLREEQVARGFLSRRHRNVARRWFGHVVETFRYFLLTDTRRGEERLAARWSASTILYIFRIKSDRVHRLLARLFDWLARPVAAVLAAGVTLFSRREVGSPPPRGIEEAEP